MKYSIRCNLRTALLCCAFLFSCRAATAQQHEYPLSIDELFTLGTENSLQLNASRLIESISQEQLGSARSNILPGIDIGVRGGVLGQPVVFKKGLSDPTYPDVPNWSQNYAVEVSQAVYQGGRIRSEISKAEIQTQIAALSTAEDQAGVKLALLRFYMDLFSYYKQREVLSRNIEEAEHRVQDISRMKSQGLVTRNDELRNELQLTNYRLAFQQAENNIAITSQHLAILLGLDESLLIVPDSSLLSRTVAIESYEYYMQQALDRFPGMQIAKANSRLAMNDIKLAKAAYLPSVALYAGNTLARPVSTSMADLYNNNWTIGLSLSYNLSSLYHNKHRMNAAKQTVALRRNEEGQLEQSLRINIKSTYLHHKEAVDRVEALKLAVRQAEENYRIVQNRYMNQLSILTDLLDASSVRLDAELQLTVARTQTLYTYYELLRASGNL